MDKVTFIFSFRVVLLCLHFPLCDKKLLQPCRSTNVVWGNHKVKESSHVTGS